METEALKLPGQDVRKLLAAANGDAALLYLYEQSGLPRAEAMERLRMTQTRYDLAAATLQQMGLWQEETKRFFAPAEAPHYTEEDVTREYHAGPEFPSMVGEAQRRLGRILSKAARFQRADVLRHLVAIHLGHLQIGQHQIKGLPGKLRQGLAPARGQRKLVVPRAAQHHAQQL